jgi:hypothetical protein
LNADGQLIEDFVFNEGKVKFWVTKCHSHSNIE